MTKTKNRFGISNFGHCYLPFDLAQGGELVEPFDICDLEFLDTPALQYPNKARSKKNHRVLLQFQIFMRDAQSVGG